MSADPSVYRQVTVAADPSVYMRHMVAMVISSLWPSCTQVEPGRSVDGN